MPGRQCNHNWPNIALGLGEDKLLGKPVSGGHSLTWPIRVCAAVHGIALDQFNYQLLFTSGKMLA